MGLEIDGEYQTKSNFTNWHMIKVYSGIVKRR